jgi:hypothetical protein
VLGGAKLWTADYKLADIAIEMDVAWRGLK